MYLLYITKIFLLALLKIIYEFLIGAAVIFIILAFISRNDKAKIIKFIRRAGNW